MQRLMFPAIAVVGWFVSLTPAPAADRPNIIVILADDLGYECLGASGGTSYKTPQLDKLAAGGVRFEHCYAQPLCTPTRVQLLTGLYNQRNYVRFAHMDPQAVTLANVLREAGYATCAAGKWQLEGGFEGPRRFGFDDYCLWQLTRRPPRYANPGLEINGKPVDYTSGEYGPDVVQEHLLRFIEAHKDNPFLAYYPMMLTHAPFEPTPDSPDWDPTAKGVRNEAGKKKYFGDMVAYMDKLVGRLVTRLEELGLRERTLIFFVGDNGTGRGVVSRMGQREVVGGKGTTTDAGTRVPLVVNWPGKIPPGRVSSDLVDSTDFLPTILEAAGVAVPDGMQPDGRSFWPQLRGERGNPREWIYSWYSRNGGPKADREFARDQRFKLYATGELYDVPADPLEKSPIARDALTAESRAAREKLQVVLDRMAGTRNPAAVRAAGGRARVSP
ncbi:MAG: sulfatase-like hydrolase/transferase [Planctomycetia bacterium]|nr:sulfatase-like hydrolase/transferase [Planctomycetia bacterium]